MCRHEPTCGLVGWYVFASGSKHPTKRLIRLLVGDVVDLTIGADSTKWLQMRLIACISESFLADVRAMGGHVETVCLKCCRTLVQLKSAGGPAYIAEIRFPADELIS